MRYGEDNYENNFLDDFSGYGGYGGLPPVTTYTPPVATYTPPAATYTAPMGGLTAAPYSPPELTPEFLAELQASAALMKQKIEAASDPNRNAAFDKYVADQAAKGVEVASTYTGGGGPLGSGGVLGVTDFAPAFDPANPAGTTGQVVRFDEGKMNAPVVFQPGQQYVLTDASGEKVVGRASSAEELQKLAAAQGNMPYGFQLYQADQQGNYKPGTQLFGQSDPRVGGLMEVALKYGLPLATAFIPGLNVLGAMAVAGGSSGFGNLLAGETPDKALTSALISAGTAGLLRGTPLGETINKAVGSVLPGFSNAAAEGAGSAVAGKSVEALAPGMLEVVGQRLGSNLISNLTTGALTSGLSNAATSALLPPSTLQPDQFRQALDQARLDNEFGLGDTVVTGTRGATTASPLTGALSGASDVIKYIVDPSEVAGQTAETRIDETPADKEIVVSSTATSPGGLNAAIATGAGGALNLGTNTPTDVSLPGEDLIDVVGDRIRPAGLSDLAPSLLSELPGAKPVTYDPNEIVVSGQRVTPATKDPTDLLAPVSGAFTAANVSGVEGQSLEQEQADPGEKKDSILSNINPVRAGIAGLAGLVRLLAGGGGGGGRGVATGNAGAGTRASLDPIFSAKLPAASPQYSGMSLAPRDMRGVDFARYGYGPGASFFENVPRNPEEYRAALAANTRPARPSGALNLSPMPMPQTEAGATADPTAAATSLIRTYIPSATDAEITEFLATEEGIQFLANFGVPVRRARGGSMRGTGTSRGSYAVKGAGTGRSDEIPALLSDGEYVMDAETVAMLGDGSSEAGAKRLDDFRINVRKHKGRNLAKGKFSANAKRPEKYLAGGRA
jgi:hypothetical protein